MIKYKVVGWCLVVSTLFLMFSSLSTLGEASTQLFFGLLVVWLIQGAVFIDLKQGEENSWTSLSLMLVGVGMVIIWSFVLMAYAACRGYTVSCSEGAGAGFIIFPIYIITHPASLLALLVGKTRGSADQKR